MPCPTADALPSRPATLNSMKTTRETGRERLRGNTSCSPSVTPATEWIPKLRPEYLNRSSPPRHPVKEPALDWQLSMESSNTVTVGSGSIANRDGEPHLRSIFHASNNRRWRNHASNNRVSRNGRPRNRGRRKLGSKNRKRQHNRR